MSFAEPRISIGVTQTFALDLDLWTDRLIALAVGLGIRHLATRGVHHYAAVRLRDGRVRPAEPRILLVYGVATVAVVPSVPWRR
jgi:hypothetical protein